MTITEIRDEVHARLAEDDTFDPNTATGLTNVDRLINESYRRVVAFNFPDGRPVRFRALYKSVFFETQVTTSTVGLVSATTTTVTFDAADAGSDDDRYNEWIIEMTSGDHNGQTRLIVDYAGGTRTATVSRAFSSAPSATDTFKLYKRWYRFVASSDSFAADNWQLDPATEIFALLKLSDVNDPKNFTEPPKDVNFIDTIDDGGANPPTSYFQYGDRVYFDRAYNTARWYKIEYMGYPEVFDSNTTSTDTPAIPAYFHDAIVQGAVALGHRRQEEYDDAEAEDAKFVVLMQTIRSSMESQFERVDGQVYVEI